MDSAFKKGFAQTPTATDKDMLTLVLNSIATENAISRALIGQLLMDKFNRARHASTKRICAVEIFCKMMETIEDLGAFCLMWTNTEPNGDPLKTYLSVKTPQILSFYAECLAGLPQSKILSFLPIETPDQLEADGFIDLQTESARYRNIFREEISIWEQNLAAAARLYTQIGAKTGKARHADTLNMFFNAKHGRKVLYPKGRVAKMLKLSDQEIAIIAPNNEKRLMTDGTIRHWTAMSFRLDRDFVQKMHEDTKAISKQLADLAHMRLQVLEDPRAFRNVLKSRILQKRL